ncbi:hypothetical protein YS110_04350 [Acidovorax sp. YS12]|nr:hypothetical protein YS110_04350 [Acidovorax sp. YS12]
MDFPFHKTSVLMRDCTSHRGTWLPFCANARCAWDGEVPFIRKKYVKPDYTIYTQKGQVAAYADAKTGTSIPFDLQARGLVEWSTTTKSKTLIYYTPEGTTPINPSLLNYARQRGVQIKQIGVP